MIRTKIATIITATILVAGALYMGSTGLAPAEAGFVKLPPTATCDSGKGIVQH